MRVWATACAPRARECDANHTRVPRVAGRWRRDARRCAPAATVVAIGIQLSTSRDKGDSARCNSATIARPFHRTHAEPRDPIADRLRAV